MKKQTLRRPPDKQTPTIRMSKKELKERGGYTVRNGKTGEVEKNVVLQNQQFGLPKAEGGEVFKLNVEYYGDIKIKEGKLVFQDGTEMSTAGQGGAPANGKYVVYGSDATLTNELIIVDGDGVSATQSSPNITLAVDIDTNPGLSFNGGKLKLDASALSALGAAVDPSDYVTIYDANVSATKKALVSNLPFTNNAGTVTPSSTDTFTNKSGNISMWTNNSNFINSAGAPVQSVNGDTGTVSLAYSDLTAGAPTATDQAEGLVEYATNAEVASAASTSVVIRPSSIGSIATSDLNNDAGFTANAGTVTSVSNTNSTISIAGTAAAPTIGVAQLPNDLTIGNGVALGSGATFNGSSAKTLSVDLNGSTLSNSSNGLEVLRTPGTITGATGVAVGFSFDGSGDSDLNIDFGNAAAGTYTNATVEINSDGQVDSVSSGTTTGNEIAYAAGYSTGEYALALPSNTGVYTWDFTSNSLSAAKILFSENQGTNFALEATAQGYILVNNTGTYLVDLECEVFVITGAQTTGDEFTGYLNLISDDGGSLTSVSSPTFTVTASTAGLSQSISVRGVVTFSDAINTKKIVIETYTSDGNKNTIATKGSTPNLTLQIEKIA